MSPRKKGAVLDTSAVSHCLCEGTGGLKIATTVADSSEEGAAIQRLARLKLHSTILVGTFWV